MFLLCVIVFFLFLWAAVSVLAVLLCSCQCFISRCDFSIDEQINNDDDDDDDGYESIYSTERTTFCENDLNE